MTSGLLRRKQCDRFVVCCNTRGIAEAQRFLHDVYLQDEVHLPVLDNTGLANTGLANTGLVVTPSFAGC